ncbi:MAG: aminotransferase class V-fold PLP-dependent enzyme, partial [bacterium]
MAFDIAQVRAQFPILNRSIRGRKLVYLDSAATTQKPSCVIEAVKASMAESNANIHRGVHFLSQEATRQYDDARRKLARFINAAEPAEVIFTKGCTESINLVASSWGRANLKAGDLVVLTEMEHHSNIVPWQLVVEQVGATVEAVKMLPDGTLDQESYASLLSKGPKMVAFGHV